jgi:hypothetical protein
MTPIRHIVLNLGTTSFIFIIIWTFITSWEYSIPCKVNEDSREFSKTYEKLTCECIAICRSVSCDDLISKERPGACCSTGYCRRQYSDRQLCIVGPVFRTTIRLGLITEDNHTTHTTFTQVNYHGFNSSSYLNQSWSCHYVHSYFNYNQIQVYPEDPSNKSWPIVLVCILGLFLLPAWIYSIINCPSAYAAICKDIYSKCKLNFQGNTKNEMKGSGSAFVPAWKKNVQEKPQGQETVIQLPEAKVSTQEMADNEEPSWIGSSSNTSSNETSSHEGSSNELI